MEETLLDNCKSQARQGPLQAYPPNLPSGQEGTQLARAGRMRKCTETVMNQYPLAPWLPFSRYAYPVIIFFYLFIFYLRWPSRISVSLKTKIKEI